MEKITYERRVRKSGAGHFGFCGHEHRTETRARWCATPTYKLPPGTYLAEPVRFLNRIEG